MNACLLSIEYFTDDIETTAATQNSSQESAVSKVTTNNAHFSQEFYTIQNPSLSIYFMDISVRNS